MLGIDRRPGRGVGGTRTLPQIAVHSYLQMGSLGANESALNHSKDVKNGVYDQGRLN